MQRETIAFRTSVGGIKRQLTVLGVISCLAAVLLLLPLLIGIWLPDVFLPYKHTLAATSLPSADTFQVIQYWNYGDFYNTELWHTALSGKTDRHMLDWDDRKQWRVLLSIDERRKKATVTWPDGSWKTTDW